MVKLSFDSEKIFYELDFLKDDKELITLSKASLEVYKAFQSGRSALQFIPNPNAAEEVSFEVLKSILASGKTIHGIKTDKEISNVIIFSLAEMGNSVLGREAIALGNRVDEAVAKRLKGLFDTEKELLIHNSGRFWYPPGGYMGWHTNQKAPGWRVYINHAEEPGKSFFRYRDPETKEIVTSWDEGWNFRLFRICPEKIFWHTVYSETNRFSLGYKIEIKSRPNLPIRMFKKAKAFLVKEAF